MAHGDREALTNHEGHYALEELPPGTYRLIASKEGFQSAESDAFELAAGQTREVNFTLRRALGAIQGVVRNTREELLGDVRVTVIAGPVDERYTFTGHGEYRLGDLPAGTYTLRFSRTGYQTLDVAGIIVEAGQTTTRNVTLQDAH